MSANIKNSDLLSSWKEIASYLDCDIRTACRWEEKYSLPIHRIERAPKSRVYAYKNELDEWLKSKLANNSVPPKEAPKLRLFQKGLLMLAAFVVIAAAALAVYFFLLRPKYPTPPGTQDTPHSTGPLIMNDNDIVTTEFAPTGKVRVWRKDKVNSYREIWRIEPVIHASVAVGNIDGKKDCEIVAPGVCRLEERKGERELYRWKYFINVYKQGQKDWWKTTYYSDEDCVFEEKTFQVSEIAIGNIDEEVGNEIVLVTQSCLAIYKYDAEEKELKLVRSRYSLIEDTPIFIKSVVVENIDDDATEEILVAADYWTGKGMVVNQGIILILKVEDDWPKVVQTIAADANLSYQSMRIGDVIDGGNLEVLSPGYRRVGDMYNTFILGWDTNGKKIIDRPIYELGHLRDRLVHLDVGNLDQSPGDEVLVGHHVPDELIYYFWDGSELAEGGRYPLDGKCALTNVFISNKEKSSDSLNEVVVCGGYALGNKDEGRFYLEVLGFSDGFFSKWKRTRGNKGELNVSYAAMGKKRD